MDRLTRQIMPDFHGYERTVCTFCPRTGVKACTLTEISCFALQVYNRLTAYEDTGLTPEEVTAQQAELTRLRAELDAAVRQLQAVKDCHTCAYYIREYGMGAIECKKPCATTKKENFEWRGKEARNENSRSV